MPVIHYPLHLPGSYIRVQTSYYKKCLQPTIKGEFVEVWMPWSAEMIKQDLPAHYVKKIQRFDGFACVPSHLNYQEIIGNFHNLYNPLEWKPVPGSCDTILEFLFHIFGEQYELGLDYLTLLYINPTQKLPVLCLVSRERKTGKSTFLNLLKLIFGKNMTFNANADFRSQFNADWMNMLLIAVDEVLLDRREDSEKIKNLSTARTTKTEAKNKDRKETEFFGKFVLCLENPVKLVLRQFWWQILPDFTFFDDLAGCTAVIKPLMPTRAGATTKIDEESICVFVPEELNNALRSNDGAEMVKQGIYELLIEIKKIKFPAKEMQDLFQQLKITSRALEQPTERKVLHHHHVSKGI